MGNAGWEARTATWMVEPFFWWRVTVPWLWPGGSLDQSMLTRRCLPLVMVPDVALRCIQGLLAVAVKVKG